ncbi:MAG: DEAD/DEAH box helicase [Armatimonadetes bacterium]|nr:DEAD/DEAH box helicase [Armatimonadota bacterium]
MSTYQPQNPLIVQSDRTLLLEVQNPLHEECRGVIARFAELEKSPEHIHTYRITPLSLWNARAAGMCHEEMWETLHRFSKFEVPQNILVDVRDLVNRYGRIRLLREGDRLVLEADDEALAAEVWNQRKVQCLFRSQLSPRRLEVPLLNRGRVKQALIRLGWPVEDLAGYTAGAGLSLALRRQTLTGKAFGLRDYQVSAAANFWVGGTERGGSGVLVLPCGAGKTVIGLAAMAQSQTQTLILATGITAARQWRHEILDKTTLAPEQVAEYSGERKDLAPVTIATYQVMTYRRPGSKNLTVAELDDADALEAFPHLGVFSAQDWGLIIYDEVHLLPAPVFRITAEIQARRRLGLTATLVREDGREEDVFSLIGPKKYDVPWRDLERQGWIAEAFCTEVRVAMDPEDRMAYAVAERKDKYRIAASNARKFYTVDQLLKQHRQDNVLIIGQYLEQLGQISRRYDVPIITGKTPSRERDRLYDAFRKGEVKLLVVSKVANFAIDLPDANVAIQISGTFGSRQEEAQRLGRILRPKGPGHPAHFYSVVTRDTVDQDFALHRQLFLTEQGYQYEILDGEAFLNPSEVDAAAARLIG